MSTNHPTARARRSPSWKVGPRVMTIVDTNLDSSHMLVHSPMVSVKHRKSAKEQGGENHGPKSLERAIVGCVPMFSSACWLICCSASDMLELRPARHLAGKSRTELTTDVRSLAVPGGPGGGRTATFTAKHHRRPSRTRFPTVGFA